MADDTIEVRSDTGPMGVLPMWAFDVLPDLATCRAYVELVQWGTQPDTPYRQALVDLGLATDLEGHLDPVLVRP